MFQSKFKHRKLGLGAVIMERIVTQSFLGALPAIEYGEL
jgi:hypothetical protein